MKLQILGSGCSKCAQLANNAEAAAQALGLTYELQKITDMNAIIDIGAMRTPALAVDGDIKLEGKVATAEEIQSLLADAGGSR